MERGERRGLWISWPQQAASATDRRSAALRFLAGGAVKMDVPPDAVLSLPDAGFFGAARPGVAVAVYELREPVIGDDGHVAHHANVGIDHGILRLDVPAAE